MKIVLLFFVLTFLFLNADQEGLKEPRVALVIGNNNYQKPLSALSNPINDAKAMKSILEKRGFEVIYHENITKREMRLSLEEFYSKIKKGGVGLFYFAGHGMELGGKNYLIPIDAKPKKMIDVEFDSVHLNRVTKNMQEANNRLNIVILDACRNNPFTRGGGGLAKTEPIGLFVSYATGAGKVAMDGKIGDNGLFTKNLIKYIQKPLSLQQVFQKTREAVYNTSGKKQFPAIYNQTINGEFFFTPITKKENKKPKERVALVIGNSKYNPKNNSILKNPKQDSKEIAKLLEEKLGFRVLLENDFNKTSFDKSLELFEEMSRESSISLIFYAGHGVQVDGENFLIPIGSKIEEKENLERLISINRLIEKVKLAKGLGLVIYDACRDKPFDDIKNPIITNSIEGRGVAIDNQLAKTRDLSSSTDILVAYSTKDYDSAIDGEGDNSPFAKALLKFLPQEGLEIRQVFYKIRDEVMSNTIEWQKPYVYSSMGEKEWYLSGKSITRPTTIFQPKNNNELYDVLQRILDFFLSNNKSPRLNTFFILLVILGFGIIIFISFTSFLYSERTNYILKALAVFLFFFGISGYIMSSFLHLSDNSSFFGSLAIGILIFIIVVFLTPKQNKPKNSIKPISLVGNQAILLSNIKIDDTGHATIITSSSRYRKLVRNKSTEDLVKGDKVTVISDEAIPLVSKE